MLKKILLGLLVVIVLVVAIAVFWVADMHEPYPEGEPVSTALTLPESPLPGAFQDQLTAALERYRARHHLPSISMAIGLDGELVYAGAVGYADLAERRLATPVSLYRIGSVSKSITTVALGRMLEAGLIDLDSNFRSYVPDFPEKRWPITLRQLASHTGGVRHYVNPLENYHDVHYDTVASALVLVADDALLFEPGTRYDYSSYGFNMLSAAMVAAADTPFTTLLEREVYTPAGMKHTLAEDARNPDPDTVAFYNQTETDSFRAPYADNSYKIAGGGLIGTPTDLVSLGNELLTGDILEPETFTLLTTTVPLNDGNTDHNYGLGFGSGTVTILDEERRELGHSGGSVGGLTAWKLFPAIDTAQGPRDLVVATTINISSLGNAGSPHAVAYEAVEQVLNGIADGTIELAAKQTETAPQDGWVSIFDGETLNGWIPKVRGYETGENPMNTFRVEDGALTVAYDEYENFDSRFGHIFYETPYSHYRLRLQYRFRGDEAPGTEGWAIRNSGAMLHSQAPESMRKEQDFPISIEYQFLGGLGDGNPRPTGNLCTPGTHVDIDGVFTEDHCINSSSPTFEGDQWVTAEALVLGDERVVHIINGEEVLEYGRLVTGGGVVSGHDPALKPEREPLASGYISLQSEGHPIQFRNIAVMNLKGCMNPHARNYAPHFTVDDPTACAY